MLFVIIFIDLYACVPTHSYTATPTASACTEAVQASGFRPRLGVSFKHAQAPGLWKDFSIMCAPTVNWLQAGHWDIGEHVSHSVLVRWTHRVRPPEVRLPPDAVTATKNEIVCYIRQDS